MVEEGSKVCEAGVLRELRFCEMVSSMVDREMRRNSKNRWDVSIALEWEEALRC